MTYSVNFEPDWVSSPGATILDLMKERHLSVSEFAGAMHSTPAVVAKLLNGIEPLTTDWAFLLARTLGSTPDFWLRRESQYRSGFSRLSQKQTEGIDDWLKELPVKDMERFGWIQKGQSKNERFLAALAFFGVTSIESWRQRFSTTINAAAYRTTTTFEIKPGAVATWIRQGEILAHEIDTNPWSPDLLVQSISRIRALTKNPDPKIFIKELIDICASCGIAVVIAPLPDGCRASGATKFITPNKALMLLSFRYLADDQFWFTVFHEIGHLLLHAKEGLFLEGLGETRSEAEDEANIFALNSIFTESGVSELKAIPLNQFAIARLAKRIGTSPGLVVGQLQELKRIPYNHFNYLKARYSWTK